MDWKWNVFWKLIVAMCIIYLLLREHFSQSNYHETSHLVRGPSVRTRKSGISFVLYFSFSFGCLTQTNLIGFAISVSTIYQAIMKFALATLRIFVAASSQIDSHRTVEQDNFSGSHYSFSYQAPPTLPFSFINFVIYFVLCVPISCPETVVYFPALICINCDNLDCMID